MLIDVAIHPFGAEVTAMVEMAMAAESVGASTVWVADHFSATMVGRDWSRDPFVTLGAMAALTERIELGVLVANVINRHPAQLASAVNSLQSLAPDRVRLGVGSGAAPGSRFASEHESIGRVLARAADRRRMLADHVEALRAIWAGRRSFTSPTAGFDGLDGVVDAAPCPPIIVGASAWPTIEVALRVADGVNIRATSELTDHLARLRAERPDGFEVSVLDPIDGVADDPGRRELLAALGVDRLIVGVSVPHDPARLDWIAFP